MSHAKGVSHSLQKTFLSLKEARLQELNRLDMSYPPPPGETHAEGDR